MNIFILDASPLRAAKYHCDKHIVKMPTETAQILSTVLQIRKVKHKLLYKPTHINHPCVKWAGENRKNFKWLCKFGIFLCREYTYRYGKIHAAEQVIRLASRRFEVLQRGEQTPFVQCMNNEYKSSNPIKAYQQYYLNEKASFAKWKRRQMPPWWVIK